MLTCLWGLDSGFYRSTRKGPCPLVTPIVRLPQVSQLPSNTLRASKPLWVKGDLRNQLAAAGEAIEVVNLFSSNPEKGIPLFSTDQKML